MSDKTLSRDIKFNFFIFPWNNWTGADYKVSAFLNYCRSNMCRHVGVLNLTIIGIVITAVLWKITFALSRSAVWIPGQAIYVIMCVGYWLGEAWRANAWSTPCSSRWRLLSWRIGCSDCRPLRVVSCVVSIFLHEDVYPPRGAEAGADQGVDVPTGARSGGKRVACLIATGSTRLVFVFPVKEILISHLLTQGHSSACTRVFFFFVFCFFQISKHVSAFWFATSQSNFPDWYL